MGRGRRRRLGKGGVRNLVEVGRVMKFWCTIHEKKFETSLRK